jgi:hypothetical protein
MAKQNPYPATCELVYGVEGPIPQSARYLNVAATSQQMEQWFRLHAENSGGKSFDEYVLESVLVYGIAKIGKMPDELQVYKHTPPQHFVGMAWNCEYEFVYAE